MTTLQKQKIAGLDTFIIPGDEGGAGILFFHGYGADANDLISLSQTYEGSPKPTWIFPNAPLEITFAPGFVGRAWFPIKVELIDTPDKSHFEEGWPFDLTEPRTLIERFIGELDIPLSKLFLGGFSQGAVLATEVVLNAPTQPGGLIILSGTLINETSWKHQAHMRKGLPFFQSHGEGDPMLPFSRAQKLESLLTDAGLQGKLHPFPGGHEIPFTTLTALHTFLDSALS